MSGLAMQLLGNSRCASGAEHHISHLIEMQPVGLDAYSDAYALLEPFASAQGRFVVHCYAGDRLWAEKFLALGARFGVTGMVTFRKAQNIRDNLKYIPVDRLFIETDSPYLAPIPHRGKENHPGYLVHIAAAAAAEYGMDKEEFARITTENGKDFFGIL